MYAYHIKTAPQRAQTPIAPLLWRCGGVLRSLKQGMLRDNVYLTLLTVSLQQV